MPNAIDLTTIAAVKAWAGVASTNTNDDSKIQDAITAFSLDVLRITGRGPADGSVPAASPFVSPQNYNENYDGNGNNRLMLRNWPITAVASVTVGGVAIPQSTSITTPGWMIDTNAKSIVLIGGFVNYQSWYRRSPQSVLRGFPLGEQIINVQYTAGFSAIPFDLEMVARRVVSLNYKQPMAIGQKSQAMAMGAGTITYDWTMEEKDRDVLRYYSRHSWA